MPCIPSVEVNDITSMTKRTHTSDKGVAEASIVFSCSLVLIAIDGVVAESNKVALLA